MSNVTIASPMRIGKNSALLALLLGAFLIGLSPIFVRLSEIGAISTAFWRVGLALLPLFMWMQLDGRNPAESHARPSTFKDYAELAFPGIMLASDLICWHIGIGLTTVANATLLANMAPVFVTLAGWLFFRTRVSRPFLLGLAMTLLGIVALSGIGSGTNSAGNLQGDAMALIAAAFYAAYLISLAKLRSRYSTATTLFWTSLAAAVSTLPLALYLEPDFWPLTINAFLIVLALAWICHSSGQGMIIYALAWLPTSFSSLTLLIQPVVAAIFAWLLFNEPLGLPQLIGGILVLGGILIARRG